MPEPSTDFWDQKTDYQIINKAVDAANHALCDSETLTIKCGDVNAHYLAARTAVLAAWHVLGLEIDDLRMQVARLSEPKKGSSSERPHYLGSSESRV